MLNIPQKITQNRLFLVGCPRSGTTLFQSLLAAHPEVISFPESHFFLTLYCPRTRWQKLFHLADDRINIHIREFLELAGYPEFKEKLPQKMIFDFQYRQLFLQLLDQIAQQKGKTTWLEKTPENILYIRHIQRGAKGAKFIHLLRNPPDTVASLYAVANQYHENPAWPGKWSIDRCINFWLNSLKFTAKYVQYPNHFVIEYEDLVEQPDETLKRTCEFIGLEFTPTLLESYHQVADLLILANEPWKNSVKSSIKNQNNTKFYQIFDQQQQAYILNRLSESQPALEKVRRIMKTK